MRMLKLMRSILPLLLFLFIIIFLWRALSLEPSIVPSPLINKSIPKFSLPSLDEPKKNITHHDFIGQITVLNIWATRCYACRDEHDFYFNYPIILVLKFMV